MNGHQDTPIRNRSAVMHGIAIAAVAALGAGLQPAWAQQNATRVGTAMAPLVGSLCATGGDGSPACDGSFGPVQYAQFAPDKFVAIGTTSLAAAQVQMDVLKDRMALVRGAGGAPVGAPPPPPPSTPTQAPAPTLRSGDSNGSTNSVGTGGASGTSGSGGDLAIPGGFGLFIRAEGQRDASDATSFDPAYARRSTAFTMGADYRVHPQAVVGLAFASRSARTTMDRDGNSSGRLEDRGSSLSIYGSWFPTQDFYVDAIVQFGRSRFDLRRDMPDISDVAIGKTSSKDRSFSIGGGYTLADGRWSWGPHARLNYSHVSIDGFAEQTNLSSTALTVEARSFNSLVSALGAQVSYAWSQSWGVVVPSLSLEWNHQFRQDKVSSIVGRFSEDDNALVANLPTTAVDKNYFTLDLGVAAHLGQGRSAVFNYSTVLGRTGQSSHTVTAELRLEF